MFIMASDSRARIGKRLSVRVRVEEADSGSVCA